MSAFLKEHHGMVMALIVVLAWFCAPYIRSFFGDMYARIVPPKRNKNDVADD